MRILLVASNSVCFGFDMLYRIPNLGLCSLAANVDRNRHQVKVIDLVAAGRKPEKYFLKILKSFNPDLVGFSSMLFQLKRTLDFINLTKEFSGKIITVLGGYAATVDGFNIASKDEDGYIDFILKGEGELSFDALLKQIEGKKDFTSVPGLIYKDRTEIRENEQGCLANLSEIKLPDRSARIIKKGFYILNVEADVVETSRGCVFNCNFCSINNMYGKSYRKYEFDRILTDIRDAVNRGAKSIFFVDDNITLDGQRFKSLCERITEEKLNNIKYLLQASVKGIKDTPGLPEAMQKAGVKYIFLGLENAYDANLKFMNKSDQLLVKDTEEVIKSLKENNIYIIGGFMLAQPEDTEESIRYNYEFAKRLQIDMPVFNTVTPYPNTKLREEMLKQNLITNLNDYSRYDCWEVNVRTKYLTPHQIYLIRDDIEGRYPLESGNLKRHFKSHPLLVIRVLFRWLRNKPSDVLRLFGINLKSRKLTSVNYE